MVVVKIVFFCLKVLPRLSNVLPGLPPSPVDDRIPVPRPACKRFGVQGDKVLIFAATLSKALQGGPSRLHSAALALQGGGL